MRIFITGGTGFIGSHLVKSLLAADHTITVLSRRPRKSSLPGLDYFQGDPQQTGPWQEVAADNEAIINLAGASLFRPWTDKNKELILESRVRTTAHIAQALSRKKNGTSVLISASAVGYYGDSKNEELDEQSSPGNDFLARVAIDWENEAEKCSAYDTRVVRCRFGIVLGPDGGALAKMIPAFKLGLGTPLRPGSQWVSWIHIHDLSSIISFALNTKALSGAVNCTAPHPVTNRELTKALAGALHRPAFLPGVPSILLKAALGESSQMLLDSQKVIPRVMKDFGFTFTYPDIQSALEAVVNR